MRSAELLGPDGPFARALGGYERREGQRSMAGAVERALEDASILLCEAGTGTGKTLAYLVPALLSGQRVVISTATKTLEDQLFEKDLPLVMRVLGVSPRVALVKGLTNYLCLRRLGELRTSAAASDLRRPLRLIDGWMRETRTGDFSELSEVGEDDPVVGEVMSSSETRIGSACEHFDSCFVTRMKRAADDAQILVVNHHVFFADLALKASVDPTTGKGPSGVLGRFDAVVFDEAHRLEEIATDFFGVRVSSARVAAMLRDAARTFEAHGLADQLRKRDDGLSLVADVGRTTEALFRAALSERARIAARTAAADTRVPLERGSWSGPLLDAWLALDSALEVLAGFAETHSVAEAVDVVRRRAERLRTEVARVADPPTTSVTWVDKGASSTSVGASFIDVGPFLREHVYKKLGAVVLTSATLTSTETASSPSTPIAPSGAGSFSFLRSRLGLEDLDVPVVDLAVGSPFDHERATLLYLPRDLPDVTEAGFLEAAARRTEELLAVTDGGAFVLSTSSRAMHALADALRAAGRPKLMVQGEAPKSHLLSAFRADGSATLVATMSFWEGVDIPGDALRLVVIDRIPFAVPTDPVTEARCKALEARGANPFLEYSVPQAAITLKQGFGRLIRTATDRGVVAVLDGRLTKKGYGARILATLPPAHRAFTLEEVRSFWAPRALSRMQHGEAEGLAESKLSD